MALSTLGSTDSELDTWHAEYERATETRRKNYTHIAELERTAPLLEIHRGWLSECCADTSYSIILVNNDSVRFIAATTDAATIYEVHTNYSDDHRQWSTPVARMNAGGFGLVELSPVWQKAVDRLLVDYLQNWRGE